VFVLLLYFTAALIMAEQAATDEALNNYDFTSSDAGASHTIPMDAGQIRKVLQHSNKLAQLLLHSCKVQP
jgi:hypothetical protein